MLVIEIITKTLQRIEIPQPMYRHFVFHLCFYCDQNLVLMPAKFCSDACKQANHRKFGGSEQPTT